MIHTIDEFVKTWEAESGFTRRVLTALTDESLSQAVAEGHRTLGRLAWHIAQTIPEMGSKCGLELAGPAEDEPVPNSAAEICDAYAGASESLLDRVRVLWTDESLLVEDDLYGDKWRRGFSLRALLNHEIHHRAQMTVLMRQAGLRVPNIYGPAKEDWAVFGREPPAV